MNQILLIGGGGHCRACIEVIETTSCYSIAGLVQPADAGLDSVLGYPVLGTDKDLPSLLKNIPCALITVGQIKTFQTRQRLFNQIKSIGAQMPVIQSSSAYCSKRAIIGQGTILMHGSIVNTDARIGDNSIINNLALVDHDVKISDHCHISTGARVNGGVSIGHGCFIGSGTLVKEGITIGKNCIISMGMVVKRDVPAGTILRGNNV